MLDNLGTQGGNLFAPAAAEGLRQLNDAETPVRQLRYGRLRGRRARSGIAGMTAAKKLAANRNGPLRRRNHQTGSGATAREGDAPRLRAGRGHEGAGRYRGRPCRPVTPPARELERFEAERRSALAVQNGTDNAIIRAAQDRQQLALKQQLTAAETIYQQKLKALPTALGSFSSSLAGVGRMAKTASSALLGAFGRPGRAGGDGADRRARHLATQEDAATKFSREHADALMLVSDNTGTAASALDAYRNSSRA